MANLTQVAIATGAIDADGLPVPSLYVPQSTAYGSTLGGALSSADAQSNQAVTPHLATAATPVVATVAAGSAGAALTCTLTCPSGKTLYLVGFSFTCSPPSTTIGNLPVQIVGILSIPTYYVQTQQATNNVVNLFQVFGMPMPASGINTNIVATYAGVAGGGYPALTLWGFAL